MLRHLFHSSPLFIRKILAQKFGSLQLQESLGISGHDPYAYGLLTAAHYTKKLNLKGFTAIEFGVANGRGLRKMASMAERITKELGVDVKVYGFDTGEGLTQILDYRDHPEKYAMGDYPLQDIQGLQSELKGKAELVLGDVAETVPQFIKNYNPVYPVGFISVDLDIYSATKSAFQLFSEQDSKFLPLVSLYFDDCHGRTEFNDFCGERLAISEFNQENKMKKICPDLGVRAKHPLLVYRSWFDKMYVLHFFEHALRNSMRKQNSSKILPP